MTYLYLGILNISKKQFCFDFDFKKIKKLLLEINSKKEQNPKNRSLVMINIHRHYFMVHLVLKKASSQRIGLRLQSQKPVTE